MSFYFVFSWPIHFGAWNGESSVIFRSQTIQGKFEDFKRSVTAKAERFSEVDNFAKRLVAEGHTDTVVIKEQQDILRFVEYCFAKLQCMCPLC